MLEAPASVLRAVAASGYQKKLSMAFTHFDLVRGQANLPTFEAQRSHVLSSVHQKLASLKEIVGQPAVRAIERDLEDRCFMLGFLDRQITEKNRGPVRELLRLIDFCEACAGDTGRAGLVHEIKFDGYRMPACNRLRRCATFDPQREF